MRNIEAAAARYMPGQVTVLGKIKLKFQAAPAPAVLSVEMNQILSVWAGPETSVTLSTFLCQNNLFIRGSSVAF